MPEKKKTYSRVIFTPDVVKEADSTLRTMLGDKRAKPTNYFFSVETSNGETWSHDNEGEFFADYRRGFEDARFWKSYPKGSISFSIYGTKTTVSVAMSGRADIETVFGILEANVEKCRLPEPPPKKPQRPRIKVFIGHGQNPKWRDLKDHLHEKHGLDVEAYELGARAGLTIRDVLDGMLTTSSFALLVLTGEDLDAEGETARQRECYSRTRTISGSSGLAESYCSTRRRG